MQKKVALVTGASGFMGRRLVDILLDREYFVIGTDLYKSDSDHCDAFFTLDLSDRSAVDEWIPRIWHLCESFYAIFDVKGLFDYAATRHALYSANVQGTQNLYEAIMLLGLRPRIVMWGAAGSYRFPKTPMDPLDEDAPTEPHGAYLESKWAQEQYAYEFGQETGIPVTIIRPGGVYGPGARYGVGHTIILAGKGMMGPFAPATGNRRGSTVHVDDVCGAAVFLAEQSKKKIAGKVFNVCDDSTYTVNEITRFIGQEVGFPFLSFPTAPLWLIQRINRNLVKKAEKLGVVSLIHPDMSDLLRYDSLLSNAALKSLGWRPKHPDAIVGMKDVIGWYREHGHLNIPEEWKERARASWIPYRLALAQIGLDDLTLWTRSKMTA